MPFLPSIHSCRKLGLFLLIGVVATMLTACQTGQQVNDRDLTWIELDAVTDAIQNKKGTLLVDPRSQARYEAFHIPGAVHIPLPTATKTDPRLEKAKLIIVYGTEWEDPIARAMSKKLISFGFKSVHTFRGGIKQWVVQGLAVEPPQAPLLPATE